MNCNSLCDNFIDGKLSEISVAILLSIYVFISTLTRYLSVVIMLISDVVSLRWVRDVSAFLMRSTSKHYPSVFQCLEYFSFLVFIPLFSPLIKKLLRLLNRFQDNIGAPIRANFKEKLLENIIILRIFIEFHH